MKENSNQSSLFLHHYEYVGVDPLQKICNFKRKIFFEFLKKKMNKFWGKFLFVIDHKFQKISSKKTQTIQKKAVRSYFFLYRVLTRTRTRDSKKLFLFHEKKKKTLWMRNFFRFL